MKISQGADSYKTVRGCNNPIRKRDLLTFRQNLKLRGWQEIGVAVASNIKISIVTCIILSSPFMGKLCKNNNKANKRRRQAKTKNITLARARKQRKFRRVTKVYLKRTILPKHITQLATQHKFGLRKKALHR